MKRRQTGTPRRWLIADERIGSDLWRVLKTLPRGTGVLVLHLDMPAGKRARLLERLRCLARGRGLIIADEAAGEAARVHDSDELRQARLAGVPLLFLSPMAHTRSHPEWRPIPRMRAAALVRLSEVPVIALGGMNDEKFRSLGRLGFHGWAGIDAWLRT